MLNGEDIRSLLDSGLSIEDVERLVRAGTPQAMIYNQATGGGSTIQQYIGSTVAQQGGTIWDNNMVANTPLNQQTRINPQQLPARKPVRRDYSAVDRSAEPRRLPEHTRYIDPPADFDRLMLPVRSKSSVKR